MDGLLAIIETILVLSLTFIALATAASALSGTGMRLVRLRARGLRSMAEYIYRNNVIPLLERLDKDYVDLSLGPAAPFAGIRKDHKAQARPDELCQFVVDMTFLPLVSKATDDTDPRVEKVRKDDWFSLKDSQEALTLDEFRQRLTESAIGQRIAEVLTKTLNRPQDVAIEFERLTKQFDAQQSGATNWFARAARIWSTSFGFFLAVGLNVDSVDLFSTYLGDPSLRRDVLARQEQILGDAERGAIAQDTPPTDTATKAETALVEVTRNARRLQEALAQVQGSELVSGLPDGEGKQQLQGLLTEAGSLTEQTNRTLTETRNYVAEVRQTVGILTAQFPIGWDRFPRCEEPGADLRCVLQTGGQGSRNLIGEYIKWFMGVLITGFLLGLGAPFWVEVFNNMMRARKLVTDLRAKS